MIRCAAIRHDAAPGTVKRVVYAALSLRTGESAAVGIAVQIEPFRDAARNLLHAGIEGERRKGIDVSVDVPSEAAMLHGRRYDALAFAARGDRQDQLCNFGVGPPTRFQHRLVIQDGDRSLWAIRPRRFGAAAPAVIKGGFIIIHDKAANPWRRRRRAHGRCQHRNNQERLFQSDHVSGNPRNILAPVYPIGAGTHHAAAIAASHNGADFRTRFNATPLWSL